MRDHRRRVENRRIVVRTEFEHVAWIVAEGREKFFAAGDERFLGRNGLPYGLRCALDRIAYFRTDDPGHDGSSYFPRQFEQANPRVPWKALADLHDRIHWGDGVLTLARAWQWPSVRIPRITELLKDPNEPERRGTEPEGKLGIPGILAPHRRAIRRRMRRYGVRRLRVCGSVARRKANRKSDVDPLGKVDRLVPPELVPEAELFVRRIVHPPLVGGVPYRSDLAALAHATEESAPRISYYVPGGNGRSGRAITPWREGLRLRSPATPGAPTLYERSTE